VRGYERREDGESVMKNNWLVVTGTFFHILGIISPTD